MGKDRHRGGPAFLDLLDQAAEAVCQGKDPRAILHEHPDAEGQLKPLLDVVAHLQVLREAPPPAHLEAGRARFLAQAREIHAERTSRRTSSSSGIVAWPRLSPSMPLLLRPVLSVLLVVLLFGLAGLTAQAASQSLPGSPLYPVKLAVEQTQVAFTFNPEAEARLKTSLAERRLGEVVRLAQAGRQPDPQTLERVEKQWLGSLEAIAATDEDKTARLLGEALGALSDEKASLYELLARAHPSLAEALQTTLILTEEMEETLREGLANPEEFRRAFSRPPVAPTPTEPAALPPTSSATPTAVEPPTQTAQPPAASPTAPATARPKITRPPTASPTSPPAPRRKKPTLPPPPPSPTPTATRTPTCVRPTKPPIPTATVTPTPAVTITMTPTATSTPTSPPVPTWTPLPPTSTPTGLPLDPTPYWTDEPGATPSRPTATTTPTTRLTPRPFQPTPPALTPPPTKPPPTFPPPPRPTKPPPTFPPPPGPTKPPPLMPGFVGPEPLRLLP